MPSDKPPELPRDYSDRRILVVVTIVFVAIVVAIVFLVRSLIPGERYEAEIVFDPSIFKQPVKGKKISWAKNRMPIIKSLAVLNEAIRISQLDDLTFEQLYQGLELKETDQGILVSFESNDAERSRKIVHAVIDSYEAFEARISRKKSTSEPKKR